MDSVNVTDFEQTLTESVKGLKVLMTGDNRPHSRNLAICSPPYLCKGLCQALWTKTNRFHGNRKEPKDETANREVRRRELAQVGELSTSTKLCESYSHTICIAQSLKRDQPIVFREILHFLFTLSQKDERLCLYTLQ